MTMKKIILALHGFILCISCISKTNRVEYECVDNKKITIQKVFLDTANYIWNNNGMQLWLDSCKVRIFFTPQCEYIFNASLEHDSIVYYWGGREDCVYQRNLDKQFKGIVPPENGKQFASIKLVDSTTLVINYFYPEWVSKINAYSTDVDTLFPKLFKLI